MKREDYEILSEQEGIITYLCRVCEKERPYTKGIYTKKASTSKWSCGCSKKKRWNEEQFKTRLLYQLPEDYKFLGYKGKYKGAITKLVIYCDKHSKLTTCTTFNYWNTYYGKSTKIPCKLCEKEYISGRNILRRKLQLMNDLPEYKEILKGSLEVLKGGKAVTYETYCCGSNTSTVTNLMNSMSCKCNFTKSKSDREDLIKLHLLLEDSGTFEGWENNKSGNRSRDRFKWSCNNCGKGNLTVFLDFKQGVRCRHCCVSGFKRDEAASLYLLTVGDNMIKVGISNKPKYRVQNIRKGTELRVDILAEIVFDKGSIAEKVEGIVKQNFDYGETFKNVITDGWTETCYKEDFDEEFFWNTVKRFKKNILSVRK